MGKRRQGTKILGPEHPETILRRYLLRPEPNVSTATTTVPRHAATLMVKKASFLFMFIVAATDRIRRGAKTMISLHDLHHSHNSLNSPGSQSAFSSRSRRGT